MSPITTIAELRRAVAGHRAAGRTIAFVPTMGALHAGHLSLVEAATRHADVVVVSIFVNPTQFDRADDLAAYPRDLDADLAALGGLGSAPDIVFAPAVDELYPTPPHTRVQVEGLTDRLCGASRPGHFDGVATIVTKLLNIVGPDVALFGRKDRQQLEVIRRLVADLDLPVTVLGVPTVREADGLALSSRNRRLSADGRAAAATLPRALAAAVRAADVARRAGRAPAADELSEAAAAVLAAARSIEVDYLEVVDPATLRPPSASDQPAERLLVAVAAFVEGIRLIDNVEVGDPQDAAGLDGVA